MRGTLGIYQLIGWGYTALLQFFLQGTLGIFRLEGHIGRHQGKKRALHKVVSCIYPTI